MRKLFFLLSLSFLSVFAAAQSIGKNVLYLEAGGNGLWGSLNYEHQLTPQPGLSVRGGVGFYTEYGFYLTLPVGIQYQFALKRSNQFIDAGLGVTFVAQNSRFFQRKDEQLYDRFTCFVPSVGYRWHVGESTMLRASVTPVFNITDDAVLPWVGISIGKRF